MVDADDGRRVLDEDLDDGDWTDCWECLGEGGHHDCGEDCCPCLHPEEDLDRCDLCDGTGRVRVEEADCG